MAKSTNQKLERERVPSSIFLSNKSPELTENSKKIIPAFSKRSTKLLRTSPNCIPSNRRTNILTSNQSAIKTVQANADVADDDFV